MNHHNNKNNGLAPDKRTKSQVSIADTLMFVLLIHAPITFALPVGNELVSGSVQVTTTNASQLLIHQGSQRAIVNWQGFSIGQHESVTIQQPNVNSALLNRVIGQDVSNIQGKLTANGQVFLINANGVIFNKTAQVDVGSLIASTLNISNQNFLANHLHFTEDNTVGSIFNAGQIKASEGGVIALIGEQIQNLGTLQASGGTVALAAGKTIDLDMQGQGLVEVKIPEAALKAQILNHGVIDAKGGAVLLTAKAAGELLNTVINNQGIIQAQGMAERNGKIVLSGSEHGLVEVGGTLDASTKGKNSQGGSIQVNGAKVELQDNAKLLATGTVGGGIIGIGDKQLTSQTTVNAGATVSTEATERGKAGSINVLANMDNGLVTVAGKLNASAPKLGDGGAIDTSAAQVKVADSAQINTHAANGKTGSWLIDPNDYVISASGGDISGATLASNVVNNNVVIESANGATAGNGDILVNDTVNYASANTLTLNAVHDVRVSNTITNTGAGTVNLRADSTGACVAGAVNCGKVLFSESGNLTANAVNIYTNPASSNLPADADGNGPDYLVQTNYLPKVTANTLISYMLVNDVNQLQAITTNLDGNYALGRDIDAVGTANWNNADGFMPIGNNTDFTVPFNGKFDGLGHTVTRLLVNRLDMSNVGLFAQTTNTSKISNVALLKGNINGFDSVGGLVGENTGTIDNVALLEGNVNGFESVGGLVGENIGTINKASYSGTVYGASGVDDPGTDSVGGLVGLNSGNIVNSNAHGSVSGVIDVGGLVGFNELGNISASYSDSNILGLQGFNQDNSSDTLGGLVGRNSGSISNSFATGAVDGLASNSVNVGGLVGINIGSIVNAYATGNSTGISDVGGLVGNTRNNSTTTNTYASGTVTGNASSGGLIGSVENGSVINNSFWNITTSGQNVGVGTGAALAVTGKTNAQMQQLSTFSSAGWDIDNAGGSEPAWRIYDSFTSPLLRNFLTPLTVTANNITKTYDGQIVNLLDGVSYSTPINVHFKTNNDPYNGAVNASATPYQPSGLYSDQLGFDISVTNGQLTINPTTLTYTANPVTRVYGASNPVFTGTVTGLVNAEALENVTQGVLSFNSNANNASNVGNYAINGSGLNAVPGNYIFAQAPGNANALTVAPAALTVAIAGSPVKTYDGTTAAVLTAANYNLVGFVAGEGANVTQPVGSYNSVNVPDANTITANLISSNFTPTGETNLSNYLLPVIASGAGAITPAALTVTANNDNKTANGNPYSGGNGVTYNGFVNQEPQNVLLGQISYGGTSQGALLAGNYAITPSGLSAVNYSINYMDGQLTIVNPPVEINPTPPSAADNTVLLSKSVTYQAPISTTPVPIQTQAGFSMAVLKDTTADYTGNTLVSCDDFQSPGQSQRLCQKLQKNGNLIIPILKVKNSAGRVKRLQMSANKQFLSLLLEDGSVRVWDFVRGDQHQIVPQQKSQVMSDISAVNDSGDLISIANQTGIGTQDVIISTLDTNQTVNEPDIHQFTPSNDGSLLLVSSGNNQLSLWNSKQNQKRWQVPYERGEVAALSINENKQYGAVLSRQPGSYVLPTDLKLKSLTDAVNIIDLNTGKIIKLLPNVGEQILSIQFTDNDTLQLKLASGEMLDWSVKSNSPKTVANFDEPIKAVDTQTKNYAYVLEDGTVRVGDGNSKVLLSIQNNQNPFTDALILDAGKKLLTVMANGELSLWDVPSGKKLLRLFSTKQGWTVMDAYGRFDGSEAAMENFSWLANENDIPLNNFSENYYEPGLLSNVLQNKDYLNTNPYGLKNGLTLPPKVELQIAEQKAQDDNLTVQMDVFDRGGGIDKINVYHNGKLLDLASVLVNQKNQQESRSLLLKLLPSPGKNTLKATVSNEMGIENSSAELSFDGKTKAYASSIRLLTIGIDQYREPKLKLNYSVSDAESIATSINNNSKTAASVNLYNENATKPKILAQLNELSQGSQQDVLIIYFAGHGLAVGKEWYFLPYETKIQPTPAQIAPMGITATELSDIFKNSKIQHILLMVDSCYSGAGMDAFSKLQNGQRYFTRQLSRTLGITVMTATTKDQQAFELKSLGHGLFTYLITQELQKDDAAKAITAHGVAQNIAESLPFFSKKMLGAIQEPAVYTNGNDFMLTGALNRKPLN